jgi:hypothetical protein
VAGTTNREGPRREAGENFAYDAERRSFGVKDAVAKRDGGSIEFVGRVTKFLFFLRQGAKPGGVSDGDWHAYRVVVQSLVECGEMKPRYSTCGVRQEHPAGTE